jgi:cobalt-zinc-cadmium efflux system outer membrane protein
MRVFVLLLLMGAIPAYAYDTLRITLQNAETRFLKENLLLLAEQYHVDAQKALIIQSRLWNNPQLSAEINAYNPDRKKYFDTGAQGQKAIALQQLILLGGKRRKQIALANQQAQIASYEFENLLRNLKYELRNSFYGVYYNEQTLGRYTHQLNLLSNIIEAYEFQSKKGNIPLKEVLRLKAVYFQLNNSKTDLLQEILDQETTLKLLLSEERHIEPQEDSVSDALANVELKEADLQTQAFSSRPDYKEAYAFLEAAEVNYRLQKSLAVPDIALGGSYDQRGGAFHNQIGLTLTMNLPVFNRNQGAVKASGYDVERNRLLLDQKKLQVKAEISAALQKLIRVDDQYKNLDQTFTTDFEILNEGVVRNFKKQNISLLEFVDFFESYNNTLFELNKLRKTRRQAFEELNTVVGTELFK